MNILLPVLFGFMIVDVPAVTARPHKSAALEEVGSRLSPSDYREVQVDQFGKKVDEITVTHEGLHFLNARIGKPGYHGLYLGGGKAVLVKKPKNFRLRNLPVPSDKRTGRYKTYVVQAAQWWNSDPVYLADESLSYLAGARTRRDLGWSKRSETIRFGLEVLEFYRLAVEETKQTDPDYDITGMEEVLLFLDTAWEEFR
mgnify:CR=1 FL=1